MNNAKIIRDTERYLKRTDEYQETRELGDGENYEVYCILKKADGGLADVVALAVYDDSEMILQPYANTHFFCLPFDHDGDLFGRLESGFEVVSLSMEFHFCVWSAIDEMQTVEHTTGFQKYLAYCKQNGITLERLRETEPYSGRNLLALYDGKTKVGMTNEKHRDYHSR